jgi:hypothetical protein
MKDWQFFLAILALLILLLPIHEGYQSKPATIEDGYYYIKCGNKFCSTEGQVVVCKKDIPEIKDLFLIEKVDGGYSIKPIQEYGSEKYYNSNNLLCADEERQIICNRGGVYSWETFQIIDIGGGFYNFKGGFKSRWDTRFCSNQNGFFLCNKTTAGDSEKIQLVTIKEIEKDAVSKINTSTNSLNDNINQLNGEKNKLQSNITGLENTHADLKGQPIKIQQIINSANSKHASVQSGITKFEEELRKIEPQFNEITAVDGNIKSQITTLNNETFPGLNKDIFDLHKQFDLLLDANQEHRTHDKQ